MLAYWRNPAATAETIVDGWIHTGDLARREAGGFFSVVGRIKEMIISGGENIYPIEVERVLCEHPAIREVAVFGMPDETYGESVCAAVVLHPAAAASAADLDAFCKAGLAAYKRPRRYHFLAGLPRNASDKVQKSELRRMFETRPPDTVSPASAR
jgi:fatty-acyl-CoA synthase